MNLPEVICSGLGLVHPCLKREHCARYVHWTVDYRSEFNACQQGNKPIYPLYVLSGTVPVSNLPQGDLFTVPV